MRLTKVACCAVLLSAVLPVSAPATGAGGGGYGEGPGASTQVSRAFAHRPTAGIRVLADYGTAAVTADVYEADDSTPLLISDAVLSLTQTRTIDSAEFGKSGGVDWDYYRLTGTFDTLYTFETTGTADTIIEIHDADTGETLGWYDDKEDGSSGSKAYWRCPSAGKNIDVRIGPANAVTGTGDYTVTISGAAGSQRAGQVFRVYDPQSRSAAAVDLARSVYSDAAGNPWHYYENNTLKNVSRVIIVSADSGASLSAMIAQPLARIYNAPVLLATKNSLPRPTSDAIKAIRANNGGSVRIYIIGSKSWVSSSIYYKLKALRGASGSIERIAGSDRYGLAALVADRVDALWVREMGEHPGTVLVANGSSTGALTDLLSASALAYRMGWPILLTKPDGVPHATSRRVRGTFRGADVIVPNSRTYVTSSTYKSLGGDARFSANSERSASAADIARRCVENHWLRHDDVVVVNRVSEALTAGSYAGYYHSPILVSGSSGPTAATLAFLTARPSMVDYVSVVGSTGSISDFALGAYEVVVR